MGLGDETAQRHSITASICPFILSKNWRPATELTENIMTATFEFWDNQKYVKNKT